jgi:hypothetical protein
MPTSAIASTAAGLSWSAGFGARRPRVRALAREMLEPMTTTKPGVQLTDAVEVCCPSVLAEPLAESDAADLARVFAARSDPVRLRLAEAGLRAGEKRARWVLWRIVPDRMDAVRAALEVRG